MNTRAFIRQSLWELFKGIFSGVIAILVFLTFLKYTNKIPQDASKNTTSEACQEQLP